MIRLLDTNHAIAFLNGDSRLQPYLMKAQAAHDELAISSTVLGELCYGAYASQRQSDNLARLAAFVMLSAIGLALGLAGCVHYEEEMTLRADGSGEATLHYWMSSAMVNLGALLEQTDKAGPKFTEEAIRKDFEGLEGVKLTEVKLKEEGGNHHAILKIRFENVERLSALGREWIQGTLTFRRERGKLFFTRTLKAGAAAPAPATSTRSSAIPRPGAAWAAQEEPPEAEEKSLPPGKKEKSPPSELGETLGQMGRKLGEELEKMGQQLDQALKSPSVQQGKDSLDKAFTGMMEEAFGSYRLKFTVHFPGPVLEVDPRGRQEGSTASWDFSLGTLMAGEEIVMQAMARAPFPWVLAGVAAGVVILGMIWSLARRKAHRLPQEGIEIG